MIAYERRASPLHAARAPVAAAYAAALFAIPFAIAIALINPLVVREGLTVVLRLGELGPLGQTDVTAEALEFGAILGLRTLLVMLAGGALLAATVDAVEVLQRFRRISAHSARAVVAPRSRVRGVGGRARRPCARRATGGRGEAPRSCSPWRS